MLHVVLDALLPPQRVIDALSVFCSEFTTVTLHLHVDTLGAVTSLVLDKVATIGVSGPFRLGPLGPPLARPGQRRQLSHGLRRRPGHPLATVPPEGHVEGAAREHVQLVVYVRSPLTEGQDFSVSADQTWRLADLTAKHMLLKAAIGWGMMRLAMVETDIEQGILAKLAMPDRVPFDYAVDVIDRQDLPPGTAATWLIGHLRKQTE